MNNPHGVLKRERESVCVRERERERARERGGVGRGTNVIMELYFLTTVETVGKKTEDYSLGL